MKWFQKILGCVIAMGGSAFTLLSAQTPHYDIIITTPGYTAIYRYTVDEFAQKMANDFRMESSSAEMDTLADGSRQLTLQINTHKYCYHLADESPVARLQYDRNRRQFQGVGFNYQAKEGANYQAPKFHGNSLPKLPALWQPQIEKLIDDKSLLDPDEPNVFLLEADIDENGIVHKIVELNGAMKQYSQVFIDKIYDLAVRGWEPATCNGVPFRTVAQLKFELIR